MTTCSGSQTVGGGLASVDQKGFRAAFPKSDTAGEVSSTARNSACLQLLPTEEYRSREFASGMNSAIELGWWRALRQPPFAALTRFEPSGVGNGLINRQQEEVKA
jgi:hypothetical protein